MEAENQEAEAVMQAIGEIGCQHDARVVPFEVGDVNEAFKIRYNCALCGKELDKDYIVDNLAMGTSTM